MGFTQSMVPVSAEGWKVGGQRGMGCTTVLRRHPFSYGTKPEEDTYTFLLGFTV